MKQPFDLNFDGGLSDDELRQSRARARARRVARAGYDPTTGKRVVPKSKPEHKLPRKATEATLRGKHLQLGIPMISGRSD